MSRIIHIVLGLCLIAYVPLYAQDRTSEPLNSNFIFHPANVVQNTEDYAEIYSVMGKYYQGVEMAQPNLLDEVFHETWFMRDTDTPNTATLNIENKSTFIQRVQDHGPYPGYASDRVFATVGLANGNLAFVRVNKAPSRSATSFILFKLNGQWILMDKVWANVRNTSQTEHRSLAYAETDSLLHSYFEALATSDVGKVSELLHDGWDKKHIVQHGQFETLSKTEFLKTIPNRQHQIDFNQLFSIELYHDNLAVGRVDFPSTKTTSFLTLFKINGGWKIASERSSSGPPP
ncbi:MAG: nuclear transport factor 2 family protein [Bacteroidota bacterium]